MIFLIEYDRQKGTIITFVSFSDLEKKTAESRRISLEVERHHEGGATEIVLLEAASEAALRRTHRRYFEAVDELTAAPAANPRHGVDEH